MTDNTDRQTTAEQCSAELNCVSKALNFTINALGGLSQRMLYSKADIS